MGWRGTDQKTCAPVEGAGCLLSTWALWVRALDISEEARYEYFCVKYSILNITGWVNLDLFVSQMQPTSCTIVALEWGDAANILSLTPDIL